MSKLNIADQLLLIQEQPEITTFSENTQEEVHISDTISFITNELEEVVIPEKTLVEIVHVCEKTFKNEITQKKKETKFEKSNNQSNKTKSRSNKNADSA